MVRTSTEKRMDITALSVQSKEINQLLHCNLGLTQSSQMKTLNLTTKQPLILECQVVKQLLTSPEWATSGAACERSSGAMPGCQGTTAEVVLVQLPHHPPSKTIHHQVSICHQVENKNVTKWWKFQAKIHTPIIDTHWHAHSSSASRVVQKTHEHTSAPSFK